MAETPTPDQPDTKEDPKVIAFREELIKVCEKHNMNVVPYIDPLGPRLAYVPTEQKDEQPGTEHPKK